ncbi:MAG: HAMP domain-containing histidine kinase [Bacteriovoracaceae bacterium]|nr:HAMP domain-containing histidine kinase [Bacteriovoracaceae bacterium]
MELAKTKNWFYILLGLAVLFIFVLGAWWLFLVFKLATYLEGVDATVIPANLALMVQWEGLSFFVLTVALGCALGWVFWQDHKKTRSLQIFYSTLTHELKTPLASMRLQAQVLSETIEGLNIEDSKKEKIERYGKRLQEDVVRLEGEIDKHLQLSRAQRGGNLAFSPVSLIPLIASQAKKHPHLDTAINSKIDNPVIMGDQTALSIIFKNLFENTDRHNKQENKHVEISIDANSETVSIKYDDHGVKFPGDTKSLGKLFFKHDSPKGSGIGLFLIKKLSRRQGGSFVIKNDQRLIFELKFKRGEDLE